MKRFTLGLSLLLTLLCSLPAQAFTLEEWHSRQTAKPAYTSQIEYSRWLAEPEIRVHADGRLYFTPYESLLWKWVSPEQRSGEILALGRRFMQTRVAQAELDPMTTENDGLPSERQVLQLLFKVMQGDLDSLGADYDMQLSGQEDDWRLALAASDKGEGEVKEQQPRHILFKGGHYIEALEIETAEGNQLTMRLSGHQWLVDDQAARELHHARLAEKPPTEPAPTYAETPDEPGD